MLTRLPSRPYDIGDSFYNLLMSDTHLGSSVFDEKAFKEDLAWAKEHKARIFLCGDIFDLILPKDAKRYTPSVLAPELRGSDQPLNDAIDYAVAKFEPVVNLVDVIGVGNHDTSVMKWHSADVVALLIERLNAKRRAGHPIAHGGYAGAIVQTFRKTTGGGINWNIAYHHGYGGEAPENRGIQNLNRIARSWRNADVIWMGHKHHRVVVDDAVQAIPQHGSEIRIRRRWLIQTASYRKAAITQQMDSRGRYTINYEVEKGQIPKPMRGVWMKLTTARNAVMQSQVIL